MNLKINSCLYLKGTVVPPPSKSYTIRAFIIASLGDKTKIINSSNSIDCKVAINSCKYLGANIRRVRDNVYLVEGFDRQKKDPRSLNVKESGTTLRFLIPLVSLFSGKTIIRGSGTLRSRPNKYLINALKKLGLEIKGTGPNQSVPITVEGRELKGGQIKIDGTLSSQFISALLITCPNFSNDSFLRITGNYIASQTYIDMTLLMLKRSGVKIKKINKRNYRIYGNQKFKGLGEFEIPPDYGLSAFLMAAASLLKSNILIRGLGSDNLIQADKKILYFLKKMGVKFIKFKDGIRIRGPFQLKGNKFILKDSPDLVPVLGILALFAKGKTRLCGIKHVRIKESNRISDFRQELKKLGVRTCEKKDELIIYPCFNFKKYAVIDPHNDHRLAMAFCVLGLKTGIVVKNIECISKSYPNFLKDLKKIGAKLSKN